MRWKTLQARREVVFLIPSGPDLFYLTGLKDSGLLLWVDSRRACLFGRLKDSTRSLWEDEESLESKVRRVGLDEAVDVSELLPELRRESKDFRELIFPWGVDSSLDRLLAEFFAEKKGPARRRSEGVAVRDLRSVLGSLRLLKDDAEIAAMRKAAKASVEAHREVMRTARSGRSELEIGTDFLGALTRQGVGETAYASIIASGPRALVLHARAGERKLSEGELVLVDAAGKADSYCSDVTRTWPVSARFTKQQREVYSIVLAAQKAVLEAVGPGETLGSLHRLAEARLTEGLRRLGFAKEELRLKERFNHGTSHWLGLEVHDSCPYEEPDGGEIRLRPGMVFTVEPGLYFRDSSDPADYRGIGVRIEDDVLVTASGCEVLSAGLEKEVEEIESLRGRGISG